MNRLLCDHDFDFNRLLLSSPPQVKCSKCGQTDFLDTAREYDLAKRNKIELENIAKTEEKELWKSAALAFLSSGLTIGSCDNSYSASAAGVADSLVEQFRERFKIKG